MARPKPNRQGVVIRLQGYDKAHYKTTDRYSREVARLYDTATRELAALAGTIFAPDPNQPFSFADYPQTKKQAARVASDLAKDVQAIIERGQRQEWLAAQQKADAFLASILDRSKLSPAELKQYEDRNLEGLAAFQGRKVQGLSLSDRVWKINEQFYGHVELALDVALGEGRSAAELSRDVRGLLKEPNRLFRRVRDKYGNLQLSKAAAAYHPGRGVYRSSAQNAMRLARTEINMAYRTADWERWQRLDFVVGIRIGLSNNHTIKNKKGEDETLIDICDELAGDYPKTFKFVGWHPNCRCTVTPIMQTQEEMHTERRRRLKALMDDEQYSALPSSNQVNDVPEAFMRHIGNIATRSQGWKSQPYYIRDNFKGGTIAGGLSPAVPHTKPVGGTPQKPNIPPQPCTEFDAWIDDLKKQSYSLGLDVSRLDSLRAAGQREPLKAEVDRLRKLADDRGAAWLAAMTELRTFVNSCKGAPSEFRTKYGQIFKANSYKLDTSHYYETCTQALRDGLQQAKEEWAKIEAAKAKAAAPAAGVPATKAEAKKMLAELQKAANKILPALKTESAAKARTLEAAIYGVEMALRGDDMAIIAERIANARKWLFTYQNPTMPPELHPGGDYLKKHNDSYEFSTDFFSLLKKKPTLVITNHGGSYETNAGMKVVLDDSHRNKQSPWHRKSVVYHEFGHAIADQRDLLYCTGTADLMDRQRARLRKREKDFYWTDKREDSYDPDTGTWTHTTKKVKVEVNQMRIVTIARKIDRIYSKIYSKTEEQWEPFKKRYGLNKHDAIEQLSALADTLRALVNRQDVGWGHSVSYFKSSGMQQHEYLAHCFENAFLGNTVFRLLMPTEYQEMIDYIKTLKAP